MKVSPPFPSGAECVLHHLGLLLQFGQGDKKVLKRNSAPPHFICPLGAAGLLTHGAEAAASAVTGNGCLHILRITQVCVCMQC